MFYTLFVLKHAKTLETSPLLVGTSREMGRNGKSTSMFQIGLT